jgi:hypothetical protein
MSMRDLALAKRRSSAHPGCKGRRHVRQAGPRGPGHGRIRRAPGRAHGYLVVAGVKT